MKHFDIILRPHLSEKSYADIPHKKYCFEVDIAANKTEIKQAIEKLFGVKVQRVNVLNADGKYKRQGKYEGYTSDYKKAYVQLTKDSKPIQFFESLS